VVNPTLEFQRFECKYLLTELTALEIQRYAASYVKPDEHAAQHADHTYSIASLYLDAPHLRLHHETQSGQRSRYKLRIRTYSDDGDAPVFFEIKRRHNAVITKSRTMLSRAQMAAFFAGQLAHDALSVRDQGCLGEFHGRMVELDARPIVIVRYRRQAYAGALEPGIRVTFDRNIMCCPSSAPVVRHGGEGWIAVEDQRVVLELKFRGSMPGWMQDLVRRFELRRTSFSKYSHSVLASASDRALGCAPMQSTAGA
jgi:hypothetical protein